MDNTLKIIIAVLSLSGLLALVTPSDMAPANPADAAPSAKAEPQPATAAQPDRTDAEMNAQENDEQAGDGDNGDESAFGDPMLDGEPSMDVGDDTPHQGKDDVQEAGSAVTPDVEAHKAAASAAFTPAPTANSGGFKSNNPPSAAPQPILPRPPAIPKRIPPRAI